MIEVELPDGSIAEFPEGTTPDVIKGALQKRFAAPQAQPSPQIQDANAQLSALTQNSDPATGDRMAFDALPTWQKPLVAASDVAQLGVTGLTGGLVNAGAAAVRAPFTDKTYSEELAAMNQADQRAKNRAGSAGTAAEVGGMIYGLGKLQGAGATANSLIPAGLKGAKSLAARTGASVVDSLAINEAMNVGQGNEFGTNAGLAAGLGGLSPAAGDVISAAGSKALGMFAKKPVVQSYDDIAAQAIQKYNAADAEGVVYSPDALKKLLSDVEGDFAKRTFEPLAQPGANVAYQLLQKRIASGQPMTAEGLKAIRSISGEQFMPGKDSNNALLNMMKQRIDDFSMNGDPANVIAGNAPKAAALRKEADGLYSRKKKIETFRKAMTTAESRAARTGSGGNLENTVKQELAKIRDNPKKGRGFTADENAAIDKVIYNQTGRDILRTAGKLSPFRHGGAAAAGAFGLAIEPITAGALMIGGTASKGIGNAIQRSKAAQIERLIASGGDAAALQVPKNTAQKAIESKRELIARLLMGGGLAALPAN